MLYQIELRTEKHNIMNTRLRFRSHLKAHIEGNNNPPKYGRQESKLNDRTLKRAQGTPK